MIKKAWFACGCFWGVEYYFRKLSGVTDVVAGYMGGEKESPTYGEVCSHTTGHYETVEVSYNSAVMDYETLVKFFFEIHDFTQTDGQGPDIGPQYLSVIFYSTEEEKETAIRILRHLELLGYRVATRLIPASVFWIAEEYHQNYYMKKHDIPYCHKYHKIF